MVGCFDTSQPLFPPTTNNIGWHAPPSASNTPSQVAPTNLLLDSTKQLAGPGVVAAGEYRESRREKKDEDRQAQMHDDTPSAPPQHADQLPPPYSIARDI